MGGVCLALAYPPFGLWPLCLVAVALLAWTIVRSPTPRATFVRAWLLGAVAALLAGRWLIDVVPRFTILPRAVGVLLWLLACVGSASTFGLGAWIAAHAARRVHPALATLLGVWVGARFGVTLFPLPLVAPLIDAPWIAQCADLVGVHGLGAVLSALAAAVLAPASHRRRDAAIAVGVALAMVLYGSLRARAVEAALLRAPIARVALVQPVVGATLRWEPEARAAILAHLQRLTDDADAREPEFVVWHEAAFPYVLPYRAGRDGAEAPRVRERSSPAPLVFGAIAHGPDGARYNAVFARLPDGSLTAPVAKRERVLFGEHIPLVGAIPWVRRVFVRVQGLARGERPELLTVGRWTLGVLNCLEDTVDQSGAEVSASDLLVNVTNDAWFDGAEGSQHLLESRWRAIETRRELVRAVNTGLSAHIDALGRVVATAAPQEIRVLLVHPRVRPAITPWAPRVVVWAPWIGLALVLAGYAQTVYEKRRGRE